MVKASSSEQNWEILKFHKKIYDKYHTALSWVKKNTIHEKGVIVNSKQIVSYQEVTGYFIPTLLDAEEDILAEQYADFLSYMQRPNGSYCGTDGKEYIFDTGQVLRGLLRATKKWERFKSSAEKTADYLASQIEENGRMVAPYTNDIPEAVHLFVLPALIEASEVLEKAEYIQRAKRAVSYYKDIPGLLDGHYITHFLGYIIDGLIDLGEQDFVRQAVDKIFARQSNAGSIPAFSDSNWTCTVGLAQFAIIAYKLGLKEQGDKAIEYLCDIQTSTGGFLGSEGLGANYFPHEEISWANKFFMDAIFLRFQLADEVPKLIEKEEIKEQSLLDSKGWNKAMLDSTAVKDLVTKIKSNDFPVWIKPFLKNTESGDELLELGSGTGEMSAILSLYERKCHLMDYSKDSLKFAKNLFHALELDGHFYNQDIFKGMPDKCSPVDWVFSSGVLEHFEDQQIIDILKSSAQIARKGVLCLVPNSHSLFYRMGKTKMEEEGAWKYGIEVPKATMKHYFEEAGLKNIVEYSVGAFHSLEFVDNDQKEVQDFFSSLNVHELEGLNQGYLLFTRGDTNG